MRRLPIYFLVDTSESMRGAPIKSVEDGLQTLVNAFRRDPAMLETAYMGIATFDGECNSNTPLTDLSLFNIPSFSIPNIHPKKGRSLSDALHSLLGQICEEVCVRSETMRGDIRPLVVILTNSLPDENIDLLKVKTEEYNWRFEILVLDRASESATLFERIFPGHVHVSSKVYEIVQSAIDNVMGVFAEAYINEDLSYMYFAKRGDGLSLRNANLSPREGDVLSVNGESGQEYKYVWTATSPSGAMKEVYFAPDKSYCLAFFKDAIDAVDVERIRFLVDVGRQQILGFDNGYWEQIFCWPKDVVRDGDKFGLVIPAFSEKFFFKHDGPTIPLKGMVKEGKWFTSAEQRYRNLPSDEVGDFRSYLNVCLHLSRGIRKLNGMGIALADFSYNQVLIDPISSAIQFVGLDYNLVVPGKYLPCAVGTPDYIAPEVYETMLLSKSDPNRKLQCKDTDIHALAVWVYMLLLLRHPLRGRQICDIDDEQRDEQLSMGSKAVFIEDPTNKVNRYDVNWVHDNYPKSKWPYLLPWMDLDKLPYTILGPHLKALFDRAFVQGLHNPIARPAAFEWEDAIIQTMDLMIPCQNPSCRQKWFVFDNSASKPKCPFCGASYDIPLPVLNLYNRADTSYKPTGMRVMIYNGTRLYQWHSNPRVARNEKLTDEQKKSLACFQYHQGKWYLRNERAEGMTDLQTKQPIPAGSIVELKDGVQIRLDDENSRVIYVQMVNK